MANYSTRKKQNLVGNCMDKLASSRKFAVYSKASFTLKSFFQLSLSKVDFRMRLREKCTQGQTRDYRLPKTDFLKKLSSEKEA